MKTKKKKNSEMNGEITEPKEAPPQYDAPDGYEERTSDLVGFWNLEKGPIHFIPLHAKVFDSNIESTKPSIIIVGHAVGAQRVEDTDGNEVVTEPNDLIGIWYKPGMMRLKDLAGIRVFMQYSGEQDTGKVNPMKTFRIMTKEAKGATLYLENDFRKKSKHTEIPFAMKNAQRRMQDDDEDFGDNRPRGRTRDSADNIRDNS
jgi:hypothetical protein